MNSPSPQLVVRQLFLGFADKGWVMGAVDLLSSVLDRKPTFSKKCRK
jgi:hypothetical protein